MYRRLGKRVVVGMSGGVDSSVAALLLKRQGFDVQGLFMSNWEEDEEGYCTNARDFQDARAVATRLDITLHRIDFARQYRDRVFEYFLREYEAGRTPNPDVLCNREIKFGVCLEYARRLGGRYFATGHYARTDGTGRLMTAADRDKDQTYFLHAVTADALRDCLFPLGDLLKSEVRQIAAEAGLPNHDKADSTGICFIGERPFREFLSRYLPSKPGPIEGPDGRVLGEHAGLMFYTIGQRQGLGIGGRQDAGEAPWYVAGKDLDRNVLRVVQGHDHPALFSDSLRVDEWHWIAGVAPRTPLACHARIRHRQPPRACRLAQNADGLRLDFDEHQRAVAPGQFAVLYADDECLGGGVISATSRAGAGQAGRAGESVDAA
jgi:tRNA-specific 2-thiouridylase